MKQDYIVGIGAANIDIYGKSEITIREHYDHPAKISSNVGGVTRNILTNYSLLGGKAKFITAIGDDSFGDAIIKDCLSNRIDTSDSIIVKGQQSGVFMQVQNEDNDMYLALCDMSVNKAITREYIRSKIEVIINAKGVIFDPSLADETIKELIDICRNKVPLFVDPVSDNYAMKLKPYVKDMYCIKPNKTELESLTDMSCNNTEEIEKAAQSLFNEGLKEIFVSLGRKGLYYLNCQGNKEFRQKKPVENVINASGAGDASMAAILYGYVNSLDISKTLDYACAAGISAITSETTINPNLSLDYLEKILAQNI